MRFSEMLKPENPFVRQHEIKKRDVVPVAMDKVGFLTRAKLEELKKALDCPFDSTTIKVLVGIGASVIQGQFPKPVLKYLISRERKRMGESLMGQKELFTDDCNTKSENL